MAVELINIGNVANDGTGDELRVAFRKINQNLEDFDIRLGDAVEGINLGPGEGIFAGRDGNDLQYKGLVGGTGVTLLGTADSVEISTPDALTDTPVVTDSGSYILTRGGTLRLEGGTGISTSFDSGTNSIVFDNTSLSEVVEDTSPVLGGNLDANAFNISGANTIGALTVSATDFLGGTFRGSLVGDVDGASTDDVSSFFTEFDFGEIDINVSSFYEFIIQSVDIDFGSVPNPTNLIVDQGSFV